MSRGKSFSESTFAFAATNEISRLDPWWATHVPILPSLRRERRGGYDVRFELPATVLLLQYKLSREARLLRMDQKPRGSAAILKGARAECRDGFCQFWTTDHQHRLLDRIARRFPYTYYVAPRFSGLAELQANYEDRTILANCIIAKLSDFPPSNRGARCRHRVISPHTSWRTYVFSKPVVLDRINFRAELRNVWEDWVHEVPLAVTVREIWEGLPRIGKTRALKWAKKEIARTQELPPTRFEAPPMRTADPFLIGPPGDEIRRRRTPRRPPWPTHLFRRERSTGFAKYDESDQIRLLALSRIFELAGLTFSLIQPSNKALDNTDFYDEGR